MNPALQVALSGAGIFSSVVCTLVLFIVADIKTDIREIRAAMGLGQRVRAHKGA